MRDPALRVALRYFGGSVLRGKTSNIGFVRILTHLAIGGVAVGTAALIVVLSVFNGLEELTIDLFQTYNAELKVQPKKGKSFFFSSDSLERLSRIEGVAAITRICSDNALARYGDSEPVVVEAKGVDTNFLVQYPLDTALREGSIDIANRALIGLGVQYRLGINLKNEFDVLQLWYPRSESQLLLDPSRSFKKLGIPVSGTIGLEQSFDEKMVIVPLHFAQELMELDTHQYTALEIKTKGNTTKTKQYVSAFMGSDFEVLDRIEQQTGILQAIKIERLFVFMAFVFIISIAAFNIFFSLAMLSIEKKRDSGILFAIGADKSLISRIYIYLGMMIGGAGVFLGSLVGVLLCMAQQEFELVRLGTSETIIQSYPVKIVPSDLLWVGVAVFVITFGCSFYPAHSAAQSHNINLK